MVEVPLSKPQVEVELTVDATDGLDTPAKMQGRQVLRGETAIGMKATYDGMAPVERTDMLREFWKGAFEGVSVDKTGFQFDDQTGEVVMTFEGSRPLSWSGGPGDPRELEADKSRLGWKADYERDDGPHRDAPFAVGYPLDTLFREKIVLPRGGVGFAVIGENIDQTVGVWKFHRSARLQNGVFEIESRLQSLAREISAADAKAAQAPLKALTEKALLVRAPAGYRATDKEMAAQQPKTAEEFAVRGALFLNRGDAEAAIKDFSEAVKLQPDFALAYADRGAAYYALGKDDLAAADAAKAIAIDPDEEMGHMTRGLLLTKKGDYAPAVDAFTRAVELRPGSAIPLKRRADVYMELKMYDRALSDFGAALTIEPANPNLLNDRCWARATLNRDLKAAMADCNAAVALSPKHAAYIDSRAMVHLRLGELDQAIADYDAALALRPEMPASLYGRGIAKLRKGMKAEGDADLAAARTKYPKIDEVFARYGLTP